MGRQNLDSWEHSVSESSKPLGSWGGLGSLKQSLSSQTPTSMPSPPDLLVALPFCYFLSHFLGSPSTYSSVLSLPLMGWQCPP